MDTPRGTSISITAFLRICCISSVLLAVLRDDAAGQTRESIGTTRPDLKPAVVHRTAEQAKALEGPHPKAEFPQPEHNFGTVWIGGMLEHTFEVRNVGDQPLVINQVKPSCGCTLAGDYDKTVAPGATGKIPVRIDTKKVSGNFMKTIRVTSNDPADTNAVLTISGNVREYIQHPRTVNMGTLQPHEEKTEIFALTNNSDQPMKLTLSNPNIGTGYTAELIEKEPGKVVELLLHGKPPYKEGRNSEYIVITTNRQEQPELKIRLAADVLPRLEVQPNVVVISQAMPKETTQTLYINNYGNSPVQLLDAKVDDPRLTLERNEIEPGARYSVTVKIPQMYQPERPGKTIVLTLDDPQTPLVEIPVRRNASPPKPVELLVDKPAPAVKFTTHQNVVIDTAAIQDEALVLKFYASWCVFCKQSLPQMEAVHQEYKDRGVRFLNVNLDDPQDPRTGRRFDQEQSLAKLKELGVTYDVVFDPQKEIGNLFRVQSYPTMVVINKAGKITNVNMGAISGNRVDDFKKQLDRILEAQHAKAPMPTLGGEAASATH